MKAKKITRKPGRRAAKPKQSAGYLWQIVKRPSAHYAETVPRMGGSRLVTGHEFVIQRAWDCGPDEWPSWKDVATTRTESDAYTAMDHLRTGEEVLPDRTVTADASA